MDHPKSSQQSSLDSLRTVEFRQTLRGYHIDDVDEYLERVAVEAEALQEQLRQTNERLKQAAERIAQLEQLLTEAREQQASAPAPGTEAQPPVSDETLQRTLLLAQRFVDQTKADAEAQSLATISKAEEHARNLLVEAESKARSVMADTERKLREEVGRLESLRARLTEQVDEVAERVEQERARLRSTLGEMLRWVDEHFSLAADEREEEPSASGRPPSLQNGAPGAHPEQLPDDDERSSTAAYPTSAVR